jgi:hypothetical protein
LEKNLELIQYFKDRKVWLLQADETPPKLTEYSSFESSVGMKPVAQ